MSSLSMTTPPVPFAFGLEISLSYFLFVGDENGRSIVAHNDSLVVLTNVIQKHWRIHSQNAG